MACGANTNRVVFHEALALMRSSEGARDIVAVDAPHSRPAWWRHLAAGCVAGHPSQNHGPSIMHMKAALERLRRKRTVTFSIVTRGFLGSRYTLVMMPFAPL